MECVIIPNYTFTDLTGRRFGRLLVIERDGHDKLKRILWKCKCDCGGHTIASGSSLRGGHTKSCGCIAVKKSTARINKYSKEHGFTHGLSKHILYRKLTNIIKRCYDKNNAHYHNYGCKKDRPTRITKLWYDPDRIPEGESVDVEGLKEFMRWTYANGFYDQPKDTPKPEMLSIERVDPNGDYSPDNCIWIPFWQQQSNKLDTIYLEDTDGKIALVNLARKYGVDIQVLRNKYITGNWHNDAIVYAAKHPEYNLHRTNEHTMYPYLDKDGFGRLVPSIHNNFFNKNNENL